MQIPKANRWCYRNINHQDHDQPSLAVRKADTVNCNFKAGNLQAAPQPVAQRTTAERQPLLRGRSGPGAGRVVPVAGVPLSSGSLSRINSAASLPRSERGEL